MNFLTLKSICLNMLSLACATWSVTYDHGQGLNNDIETAETSRDLWHLYNELNDCLVYDYGRK